MIWPFAARAQKDTKVPRIGYLGYSPPSLERDLVGVFQQGLRNIGYVDGQTTNPTLVSKNPEVRTLVSSGKKFSSQEELAEYKKIVQTISPLVGGAGVSIEVYADFDTTAEQMLAQ